MKNLLLDLEREFGSLQEVRLKALQDDSKVLGALLKSPKAKERFFTHIDGAFIFQKERFLAFLNCRQLGGSYTAFVNKKSAYRLVSNF